MAVENVLPSSLKFCPYVFRGSNSGQRDLLVFQFATAVKICTKSYQQFSSLFNSREHIIVLTSFVSALRRAGNLFFRSPLKSSHPS